MRWITRLQSDRNIMKWAYSYGLIESLGTCIVAWHTQSNRLDIIKTNLLTIWRKMNLPSVALAWLVFAMKFVQRHDDLNKYIYTGTFFVANMGLIVFLSAAYTKHKKKTSFNSIELICASSSGVISSTVKVVVPKWKQQTVSEHLAIKKNTTITKIT